MTLVNTATGELIEPLSEDEARRLTMRIGSRLSIIADGSDAVVPMIRQARDGLAWKALGYKSWTDYVATEFADSMPRLTKSERLPFVAELSAMGMSTRAIAPLVGVTQQQVTRDVQVTHQVSPTPQAPDATIPQGEPVSRDVASGSTPQAEPSADASPEPARPARPAVVGRDGKTYRRPEPPDPDALIAEFPDLAHYSDRPRDVVRIGMALRGYDEPERSMRVDALRKTIAAERRRADEPTEPAGPDFEALAHEIFIACNAAARTLARCGGLDTITAALGSAYPDEIEAWRGTFTTLAETCGALAQACKPGLRRIK